MATNKNDFINLVTELISTANPSILENHAQGLAYWENFSSKKEVITEKGQRILDCLSKHKDSDVWLSAEEIGIECAYVPKSVSGALRKLVDNGFVQKKKGETFTVYQLTK